MAMAKYVEIGEVTYYRSDIPYADIQYTVMDNYKIWPREMEWSFTDMENFYVGDNGIEFSLNDFLRMLYFIAMAMAEITYGELTERLRNEIELDLKVWDTGELFQLMKKKDAKLIKEHIEQIKMYLESHK